MGTGRYSSCDVELTDRRRLVLKLKMTGDILPLTRKATGLLQLQRYFYGH
jgi:hypothetical protein